MKLLLATRNVGKLEEMEDLLQGLDVQTATIADLPQAPHVEETGSTLQENAAMKASQCAKACGMHAVADDSGLFVDALGGRPGVRSARYAGPGAGSEALCGKLLEEMQGVPRDGRSARFRCCIVLADPGGGLIFTVEGAVEGIITEQMRGTGGFGYDPVFYHPPSGATFAEVSRRRKNAVSHRGRALRRFREELASLLGQS